MRSLKVALGAMVYTRDKLSNSLKTEPFNGQRCRRQIIEEITSKVRFKGAIETGTGLGSSTEFLHKVMGVPVYSCDLNPKRYGYCRLRFIGSPGVSLYNTDSALFLQYLKSFEKVPKKEILFYLDAHWGSRLPLSEEVDLVSRNWSDSVVIIDDFKVPGDKGYGYDTYGSETLDLEYIRPLERFHQIAFPAKSGKEETGPHRGAVFISTHGGNPVDLSSFEGLRLYR